jgi:Fuc2NAc and GlcNAc transferase
MLLAVFIFLISFFLTWVVRSFAIRKAIMDIPNDRSSHTVPTPRGGGLAVAVAWFTGITISFFSGQLPFELYAALLCGIPLTLIGFADDIFNLKPGIRFLVQFLCAIMALYFLKGLHSLPLASFSLYNFYLLNLLAFFSIVWFINLFNFLDGIDGYITTETVFIGLAFWLLGGSNLGWMLIASVFGFLLWNWPMPKAKIFMGDVGSTLIGFTVAVIIVYYQNTWTLSLPVCLILTSVFWFDATFTLWRRFRNKEKLSQAHRKHAYQRLVQSGFSHRQTVLWALLINLVGFGLAWLGHIYHVLAWGCLIIDLLLLWFAMKYVDKRKPFEMNQ